MAKEIKITIPESMVKAFEKHAEQEAVANDYNTDVRFGNKDKTLPGRGGNQDPIGGNS